MQIERWKKIEQLFEAAQDQPEDYRAEFLHQACPEDPELCAEVLSMLRVGRTGEAFLDTPPMEALAQRQALREGDRLGSFEIVSLLGRGGMGEVYRARDPRLQREVALKLLPPSFVLDESSLRRFQQEARSASRLNHPNILTVFDIGTHSGTPYIVTELLPGATLQELLARGPLPLEKVLVYAQQLASGLEAAHESGIIHRDIKPANLAITADGALKILDFGLAKLASPTQSQPPSDTVTLTGRGLVLGTAPYMSPEQARLEPLDKRSDIWAFGLVLWEMLTGKRLFGASNTAEVLHAVLHQEIDFAQLPGNTPPAIRTLLARCLERDVKRRLRDIGEARVVLDSAMQAPETAQRPPRSRYRQIWIAAAAVMFVCLASLAVMHLRESAPPRQRIEFEISPPPGSITNFQLSPDGRHLAVVASIGSLYAKVWVRSLDSLETRLLTELHRRIGESTSLFWSPDGRFLAVSLGGHLCKIPRGGGPPIVLADVPQRHFGGAWLDTGDIVLAAENGILRVPSSGGSFVPVGVQDAYLPAPLPGGRLLFHRRVGGTEGKDDGIYAASLDGRPPIRILSQGTSPLYVPPSAPGVPGTLLFRRGDVLWAQPFDADRLAVQGEPVTVVPQVTVPPADRPIRPFTASSTGALVYRTGEFVTTAELVWLDRSGRRMETLTPPFVRWNNLAIRLSPDDSKAIINGLDSDQNDLWIADFSRRTTSRFTFHRANSGIWSPDGKKVLWAGIKGQRYLRPADGSGKDELIYENPVEKTGFPTDWSRDGKWIAFSEITRKYLEIWLVSAIGSRQYQPYVQADFSTAWGQFSPNCRWMAYVEFRSPQREQVIVESIPPGARRWQVSTDGGDWPVWRRDGKELFYADGHKLMSVAVNEREGLVEFGPPRKLFEFYAVASRFQVSRDGQRFLVAIPAENSAERAPLKVDTDWRAGLASKP